MERPEGPSAGDVTLAAYEAAVDRYRAHFVEPGGALLAFLDRVADAVGAGGDVLELGSGLGWDARYLEGRGLRVHRTDGARAFVDLLRGEGHEATLLDVRSDDLGGPYGGVFANAVLLHLARGELAGALARARRAVVDGGVLAMTLKEGDGDGWTEAKLGLPRHFTYWREPAVRAECERAGWRVESLDHVAGRTDPWLYVLARAG